MHILLIGTGYVGIALLTSWSNPNDHFLATTTTESKLEIIKRHKRVQRSILLNITEESDLKPYIDTCDAVVICVAPKNEANYSDTYLTTAISVRRALIGRDKPLALVYTSSTGVYGDHKGGWVDENSDQHFSSKRGEILSEVENTLLSCANAQIDVCILRLGGIYGPSRTLDERARRLSTRQMEGIGGEPTNHTHLQDITSAIEFCIQNRLNGIYNLVGNDHPCRKELYTRLCTKLGIPPPKWDATSELSTTSACVSNKKIQAAGYILKRPTLDN